MKVGLVLGGGGAKSFAHLGVYDELVRNDIKIDYIVSSSMGSLMGALISRGISSEDIKKEFYKFLTRINWFRPVILGKGFFSQSNIIKLLNIFLDKRSFSKLKIPLTMIATDLRTGTEILLEKGDIVKAVCASCAFPGVYKPIKLGNYLLADGGIINNVPADVCRKKIGKNGIVISSILDSKFDTSLESLDNPFQIVWRSIYIPLIQSRNKITNQNSDIILRPLKNSYFNFHNWKNILKFYNPKKLESFYEKGVMETRKNIKKIKSLINN